MKLLLKLFRRPIKKILIRELENNRDYIVGLANAKLDLPKLNEDEEAQLLSSLYIAVLEALTLVIERM